MRPLLLIVMMCGTVACGGPADPRHPVPSGDAARGRALIEGYGCGTCHTIPGVRRARALVGPPLGGMADRGYIGGVLPNTEADMIRWLQDPPAVDPRTVMPNLSVSDKDARDMTAYLFRLRAEPVLARMLRGFLERAAGRQMPDPLGTLSARFDR